MYGVVHWPRPQRETGSGHGVRRGAEPGPDRTPDRPGLTPKAAICWCWPATPRDMAGCPASSAPLSCAGGQKGRPVYDETGLVDGAPGGTGWCSPAAARARCRRRWTARPDGSGDGTEQADRHVRPRQRRVDSSTTTSHSTMPATTRCSTWPGGQESAWWRRTTCTTQLPPMPRWRRCSRQCGPAAVWTT